MISKEFGILLLTLLFVLTLFVVQPSKKTKLENQKITELTERFDKWQGKMEALKAENFELREGVKQLKLLVEKMGVKWMLQAKQQEDSCDSQQEVIFSTTAKDDATQSTNNEPIEKVNLKEMAKTWLVEEGLDCTSPPQAYFFNFFLIFSMFSLLKKLFLLCLLKLAVYWKKAMKGVGKKPSIFRMISKYATKYAIQMMPKVLLLGVGTDFMFLILMSFPAYVFQYLS